MNDAANQIGERVTFKQLFSRHPEVEIPIIQRDYAQGRKSEVEVRAGFLDAIHSALSKEIGAAGLPLDLDFVYGSVDTAGDRAFCPLDGQQRLTTLFLLHWYLAWHDGWFDDFAAIFRNGKKSRLSYEVRSSSHEFFDALVNWAPEFAPTDVSSLSDIVIDQPWFFLSWKLDPTIQSVLVVFDAIHKEFADSSGFYERIVREDHPYITFQLLDLRRFNLSDDLYIKMNARGKPLTNFETFKARLEKQLDDIFPGETRDLHGKPASVKEYFSHRIDTDWADVFWTYRDAKTHLFDDQLMNLIRAVAIVTRDPVGVGAYATIEALRDQSQTFSFRTYENHQCLDRPHIETLIRLLDSWCGDDGGIKKRLPDASYYNERVRFKRVVDRQFGIPLTYAELVQFHAYAAYIREHGSDITPKSFGEWMRVICNLAINSNIERPDEFMRSIRSVNELLPHADNILAFIADEEHTVRAFSVQQVREERLKACLILKSDRWREAIRTAEKHGYFRGQIEFLLKFAGVFDAWQEKGCDWDEAVDVEFLQKLASYFEKASEIFDGNGLRELGEYRAERALLAVGDYLMDRGLNRCFLVNSDAGRDPSWKRLLRGGDNVAELRRGCVKILLDRIDLKLGVTSSLDKVISDTHPPDDWRRLFCEDPDLIGYCGNRQIRWVSPKCVYLLRKSQMNGEHAELFSYQLYRGPLMEKHNNGELNPFGAPDYLPVNTDSIEPSIRTICKLGEHKVALRIRNKNGSSFVLTLSTDSEGLPEDLKKHMKERLSFGDSGSELVLYSDRLDIIKKLDEVVEAVRAFPMEAT